MTKVASKVDGDNFVRFEFADGELLQCDVSALPREIVDRLALHGIKQKVGDSYAGAESVKEAFISASVVWENLKAGMWSTKISRGGKIVEALSRVTGRDYDECLEKYQMMSDDDRKNLRKHPQIKQALAEIEAENAAKLADAAGGSSDDLSSLFS